MANNIQVSTGLRNALLNATGMNSIFDSGKLRIYSGTQPTEADDTVGAGTLLADITLPADSFGAASAGAIAKSGTWETTSADATGTAAWFRLQASGDLGTDNTTDERIDGECGTSASDLNLDSLSITSGQTVTISTFTITLPAS